MGSVKKPSKATGKQSNEKKPSETRSTRVKQSRSEEHSSATSVDHVRAAERKTVPTYREPKMPKAPSKKSGTSDKSSNLDRKSKPIKSKASKSASLPMVGTRTNAWIKNVLHKSTSKSRALLPSFVNRNAALVDPSMLHFMSIQGILLAQVPSYSKDHQAGIIQLLSNISKETRKASHDIDFILLFGSVVLTMEPDKEQKFEEGAFFRVQKGVSYGLKNVHSSPCLIQFHTKVVHQPRK